MLKIFNRNKPKNKILKLYSLGVSYEEREKVIQSVLDSFDEFFEEQLNEFDIHGPYGISKGKSVGYKAFTNKLSNKGHSKYTALQGSYQEYFGFYINYQLDQTTLEIIVWYREGLYPLDLPKFIQCLLKGINLQYGFAMSLPTNYDVVFETKIKKSFGSISVSTSPEVKNWLGNVSEISKGKIRGIFPVNIVNEAQKKYFDPKEFKVINLCSNLDYVQKSN